MRKSYKLHSSIHTIFVLRYVRTLCITLCFSSYVFISFINEITCKMINIDNCYYLKTITALLKVVFIAAEFLVHVLALQALLYVLVTTGTGTAKCRTEDFPKHLRNTYTHKHRLNTTYFWHLLHMYIRCKPKILSAIEPVQ